MSLAEYVDAGGGATMLPGRAEWLASRKRAGLARPPSPEGLGLGQSGVGGSLAPLR